METTIVDVKEKMKAFLRIVLGVPKEIYLEKGFNRLHNPNGPSKLWDDKPPEYYIRGLKIEKRIFDGGATKEELLGEKNVEMRAVMMERAGPEKAIKLMGLIEFGQTWIESFDGEKPVRWLSALYISEGNLEVFRGNIVILQVMDISSSRIHYLYIDPNVISDVAQKYGYHVYRDDLRNMFAGDDITEEIKSNLIKDTIARTFGFPTWNEYCPRLET